MFERHNATRDDRVEEIPEIVLLNEPGIAWQVWSWLEATEWRWPPDVLLRQPEALMEDIATLAWLNGIVRQMAEADKRS